MFVYVSRFDLVGTLIGGGLVADSFPDKWGSIDGPVPEDDNLYGYKFCSPLSFVSALSPFSKPSIKVMETLIQSGKSDDHDHETVFIIN